MTEKQKWFYFKLWRQACQAQGWNQSDTAKRHEVTLEVLGYHKSSKFFTNQEFDRIKRRLVLLANPNDLNAAIADSRPEDEERKRLLYSICSLGFTPRYIAKITIDRWDTKQVDQLSIQQLDQLKITLIQRKRAMERRQRESTARATPF